MARRPTTVRLDEKLLSEVHAAVKRIGISDDDVIEEAVRRFVGLEVLDEPWSRNHLAEDQAMELAVSELRAMRSKPQA